MFQIQIRGADWAVFGDSRKAQDRRDPRPTVILKGDRPDVRPTMVLKGTGETPVLRFLRWF